MAITVSANQLKFKETPSSPWQNLLLQGVIDGSSDISPATRNKLGGVIVGDNLLVNSAGVLSVDTASSAESDNTKPITSAAVYTAIGNINALLETI